MSRLTLLAVAAALVITACSSGDGTPPDSSADRPVTSVDGFAAIGPLEAATGSVPRFEWSPINGAAAYRLAVLGPDGPIWAWEGTETSVNLGGLTSERPEDMPGPVIVDGTSWSVAAIDATGNILDLVGPIILSTATITPSTASANPTSTSEATADQLPNPCIAITQEAIDALFGGAGPQGVERDVPGPGGVIGGRSCVWSQGVATLNAAVFAKPGFLLPLDICNYCETVDGLGDEAWGGETDLGSGNATLAIIVNGRGIQLSADGLGFTIEQLQELAAPILADLS